MSWKEKLKEIAPELTHEQKVVLAIYFASPTESIDRLVNAIQESTGKTRDELYEIARQCFDVLSEVD